MEISKNCGKLRLVMITNCYRLYTKNTLTNGKAASA